MDAEIKILADDALLARLDELAGADRQLNADIVVHLAVLDARGLHLDLGFSSLYAYATERLRFAPQVAYKRIRAARVARSFPEVVDALRTGELTLSSLLLLAPELLRDKPNVDLLEAAKGKSVAEVKAMLPRKSRFDSTRIEMHVDDDFVQKLNRARALFAHQVPDGNIEAILAMALDNLISTGEKKRFGVRGHRRKVYERDQKRCSFVSKDGRRCNATAFLELDHRKPRALGGPDTEDNLRILCRAHNQREAEKAFGKEHVEKSRMLQRRRSDVCSALQGQGYRSEEIRRVLCRLDTPIHEPIEKAIREAKRLIGSLTFATG